MGFLVRAKPRVESDERSFLKGLVSKRLEEMESGTPPIDPLELLGLTGSAPSPVPNTTPATSSSKEEAPTATRVADATTTAPSRLNDEDPTSASPIQSVIAESLSENTHSVVRDSVIADCIIDVLAGSPSFSIKGAEVVVSATIVAVGASSLEGLVVGVVLGTRD